MKIISLLPSATEIVYALGLGDALEGVSFECDHPPEARAKPVASRSTLPQARPLSSREIDDVVRERMGRQEPIYAVDRDLFQRVQPDLILTQDLCRVCAVPTGEVREALDRLGCRSEVLSLEPNTLEDILESIELVGRATGTEERAREITAGMRERIRAVESRAARLPTIRTFCLEWLDPPFAGGHWIPEMVAACGGENLLSEAGKPSRTVTWREVSDAQPEVLAFMPCGYYLDEAEAEGAALYGIPELRATTAVASDSVFAVDASSYFSRPGPRIVDGLEILAWAIHPDAFPEPPPGGIARVRRP